MYIQEIPRGSLRDQTIQTLLNNLSEIPDAKKERVEYLAYLASTPELKAWIFEKAKELKTK